MRSVISAQQLKEFREREDRVGCGIRLSQPNAAGGSAAANGGVLTERLPKFRMSPTAQPTSSTGCGESRLQLLTRGVVDDDRSVRLLVQQQLRDQTEQIIRADQTPLLIKDCDVCAVIVDHETEVGLLSFNAVTHSLHIKVIVAQEIAAAMWQLNPVQRDGEFLKQRVERAADVSDRATDRDVQRAKRVKVFPQTGEIRHRRLKNSLRPTLSQRPRRSLFAPLVQIVEVQRASRFVGRELISRIR